MPLYNIYYTKDISDLFLYDFKVEPSNRESILSYYKSLYSKKFLNSNNIAMDAANTALKMSIYGNDIDLNK